MNRPPRSPVSHHGVQDLAQACNSPISKGFAFLCFAPFCTVLRSRWCQSGVIIRPRNTEAIVSRQPLYARTCSVSYGYSRVRHQSLEDRHPTVATANGAPTIIIIGTSCAHSNTGLPRARPEDHARSRPRCRLEDATYLPNSTNCLE